MQNKPAEAIPLLEKDVMEGRSSADVYNALGLSYYQTGNYEKSAEAFEKGIALYGENKILSFNAGNAYYAMGNYQKAVIQYTHAFSEDAEYSRAVLNRGNAELMMQHYERAVIDYKKFLELAPFDSQAEEIKKLIALLEAELERIEAERLLLEALNPIVTEKIDDDDVYAADRIAEEERLAAERLARENENLSPELVREENREEGEIPSERIAAGIEDLETLENDASLAKNEENSESEIDSDGTERIALEDLDADELYDDGRMAGTTGEEEKRFSLEELLASEIERILSEKNKDDENELTLEERIALEVQRIAAEKKAQEDLEAAQRREEIEKLEAERKAMEEARRKRLLEDVANSLQNTDSTNMTSGAEGKMEYGEESELD